MAMEKNGVIDADHTPDPTQYNRGTGLARNGCCGGSRCKTASTPTPEQLADTPATRVADAARDAAKRT